MSKTYSDRVQDELGYPDADVANVLRTVLYDYEMQGKMLDTERTFRERLEKDNKILWQRVTKAEQFENDTRALVASVMGFISEHFSEAEGDDEQ